MKPGTGITKIENDDRKNSLQQCPVNELGIYTICFLSLLSASITNCNCKKNTSFKRPKQFAYRKPVRGATVKAKLAPSALTETRLL